MSEVVQELEVLESPAAQSIRRSACIMGKNISHTSWQTGGQWQNINRHVAWHIELPREIKGIDSSLHMRRKPLAFAAVAERHCWNWEFVRDWLATRLVADAAPGTSHGPRPFQWAFPMLTSNRSDFQR
jgi:hypothetical protein